VVTCIYTPLAMLIMGYALFTYQWRAHFMSKKIMGMVEDRVGPTVIAVLVLLTLASIFCLAVYDFIY
jgi:fumarate reductase subunit D